MRKLTLATLRCNKTEDTLGTDTCRVEVLVDGQVDGATSGETRELNDGHTWELNRAYAFKDQIEVRVWDKDTIDPDDLIGRLSLGTDLRGAEVASFVHGRARYTLGFGVAEPDVGEDGSLVKEASRAEVYVVYDGAKIHIPTPDALFVMGYGWHHVRVVPDGALAGLPTVRLESRSATPGSLVFPPDHHKWYPIAAGGTRRLVSRGKEIRLIELQGWLYPDASPSNVEGPWNDWHYNFEVDPEHADAIGLDLNDVLRVTNIVQFGIHTDSLSFYNCVAVPLIHVEINGWKPGNTLGVAKPADWGAVQFPRDGEPDIPETHWPFDPRFPTANVMKEVPENPDLKTLDLDAAPYAKIVGSLVTDEPHYGSAGFKRLTAFYLDRSGSGINFPWVKEGNRFAALKQAWGGSLDHLHPANVARYTELHPPDYLEILPPKKHTQTVRGVALLADNGAFSGEAQSLDIDLFPPQPRPPGTRVGVRELVGPETNFRTIVEGNAAKNGARIDVSDDHVHIHVKVEGKGGWGAPGKFKAIYRVFWEPIPRDAAFVQQSVPAEMTAGSAHDVWVELRNTGAETWRTEGPNYFALGSQNPQDNNLWGTGGRVGLPRPVAPGETVRVGFRVTAPGAAGTYDFQWRMLQEFVEWFGEFSPNVRVRVPAVKRKEGKDGKEGKDKEREGKEELPAKDRKDARDGGDGPGGRGPALGGLVAGGAAGDGAALDAPSGRAFIGPAHRPRVGAAGAS